MNEFWNQRYAGNKYAYGTTPNEFLSAELQKIYKPGKILFPAEGEGRNAVFAATLGWDVVAFDPSETGQEKALVLAAKNNVSINYLLEGYQTIDLPAKSFDVIVLCFAHMPVEMRTTWHEKLSGFLKPGGKVILEGFSEKQLARTSGGPQNIDFLFSKEKLETDFAFFSELQINETERHLNEGACHQGVASLMQLVGVK